MRDRIYWARGHRLKQRGKQRWDGDEVKVLVVPGSYWSFWSLFEMVLGAGYWRLGPCCSQFFVIGFWMFWMLFSWLSRLNNLESTASLDIRIPHHGSSCHLSLSIWYLFGGTENAQIMQGLVGRDMCFIVVLPGGTLTFVTESKSAFCEAPAQGFQLASA